LLRHTDRVSEPVTESIFIEADPVSLYDMVADVSRMGEWSPESTGALGAARKLAAGEKFTGLNKRGPVRWATICTVRDADRGRRFSFDVDFGPVTISFWSYDFAAEGTGTRVTETWVDRRAGIWGPFIKAAGQLVIPGSRPDHNRSTMIRTLTELKAAAESAEG
jgi:hypothetical protein